MVFSDVKKLFKYLLSVTKISTTDDC